MNIKFDFANIRVTEFGAGLQAPQEESERGKQPPAVEFRAIPTNNRLKEILHEIIQATLKEMDKLDQLSLDEEDGSSAPKYPSLYEPSQRREAAAHLWLPLKRKIAARILQLHEATSLDIDAGALDDPTLVFCYFIRLIDASGNRLTAMRRAASFKAILKSRLIHLYRNSLSLIEHPVFKLDNELDFVTDSETIHILHPAGFEEIADLERVILKEAKENVTAIGEQLGLNIDPIAKYASEHILSARVAASILSGGEAEKIDKNALQRLCRRNGVNVVIVRRRIDVQPGHERAFLEVLDRRRYNVRLVRGVTELFRANSRQLLASRSARSRVGGPVRRPVGRPRVRAGARPAATRSARATSPGRAGS